MYCVIEKTNIGLMGKEHIIENVLFQGSKDECNSFMEEKKIKVNGRKMIELEVRKNEI